MEQVQGGATMGQLPHSGEPAPAVSVCVAVWREHGPPNLASLCRSLGAALDGLTGELVVALNGLTAEQAQLPTWARSVAFDVNRGVPRAWNAVAGEARGDVLCFVNDDVSLGSGAVRLLHDTLAAHPEAGVVGPVGTDWDLEQARHMYTIDTGGLARGELRECNVVSGFLFATPRSIFERAGGFDEVYTPCLFEEVDYSTTVRRKLGLRCFAVAGVPVEHSYGFSHANPLQRIRFDNRTTLKGWVAKRNRYRFRRKWGGSASPSGMTRKVG